MRIGTAEPNSTFLHQGLALKAVLERRGAGPVEILTALAASTENAQRLEDGDLDFGFMASNWIGRARLGQAPFSNPIDLRMVAPANAGPLFFIVRADSPMRTVADLRGKRVCTGAKTSGMTQHAHTIFNALGMTFDDITPVYLHFAEGGRALEAGEVYAQLQCPIPNPEMTSLDQRCDLRVLPYAAGDLEKVMAAVPWYRPVTMEKGQLRALQDDVAQAAVVNVLVTHARQDVRAVETVARAMAEDAAELVRLNPLYRGMERLFEPLKSEGVAALEFGGVKLHEGAVAAYRGLGLLK
jgi:TRAP transporter TAXI family solute receptor